MLQTLDHETLDKSAMESVMESVSLKPLTPQPIKAGRPKGKMPKLPSDEKPKKPKKWADDILAYHRQYYQDKLKHPCSCEICGRAFTSVCGYKRHKKECKSCKIIQQIREEAKRGTVEIPEMVLYYKDGDAVGDILCKMISL